MIELSTILIRVLDSGKIWTVTAGRYLTPEEEPHPYVSVVETTAELFAALKSIGVPYPATLADFDEAIKIHLDAVARERDFDGQADAVTFANSTQAAWSAEALAFIAWRDSVWLAFEAAKSNLPATPAEFISGLTAIEWPAPAAG